MSISPTGLSRQPWGRPCGASLGEDISRWEITNSCLICSIGCNHSIQPLGKITISGVNLQVATLCNTYISDITSQSDRTSRISLLDAFVMLAMPFGNLIGARLYLHFGYYITFAASGFFAISGALYVALVLKETVVQSSREEKERRSICQVPQSQNINTMRE